MAKETSLTVRQEMMELARHESLPKSLVPTLEYFRSLDWTPYMIQAVVGIPSERVQEEGRRSKVKWFLTSMRKAYSRDDLASMAHNPDKFINFLGLAKDIEDAREEIFGEENANMAYKSCFDLAHSIGLDRVRGLYRRLVEETGMRDTHLWRAVNFPTASCGASRN